MPRRVSRRGVRFIAQFEGFPSSQPYNDPVGHCTVGYGHLLHFGNCTQADRGKWHDITKREARRLLRRDLQEYADAVRNSVHRRLRQRDLDALTSFTFNNGIGAFQSSTLLRRLNAGENKCKVAREELPKWVHAGDQVLPGLVVRRKAEARLICTGKYH